ncbi:MAG: LURP-one-related family protein [Oscillospiraceae bacterium]|nr:LURP-one-related family protein [Oscillospiraceae bacterium]
MRMLFKQKLFSWLDSYDIYNEFGEVLYSVKGKLGWGHILHIHDRSGAHIATLKERVLSFLPRFEIYIGEQYMGCIRKEFTLLRPKFTLECSDWEIDGSIFELDYSILSQREGEIARITKELFHLTDTYVIDVREPRHSLLALMVVLAIDAEKCSRD